MIGFVVLALLLTLAFLGGVAINVALIRMAFRPFPDDEDDA